VIPGRFPEVLALALTLAAILGNLGGMVLGLIAAFRGGRGELCGSLAVLFGLLLWVLTCVLTGAR
jgi:hypothetical protein